MVSQIRFTAILPLQITSLSITLPNRLHIASGPVFSQLSAILSIVYQTIQSMEQKQW